MQYFYDYDPIASATAQDQLIMEPVITIEDDSIWWEEMAFCPREPKPLGFRDEAGKLYSANQMFNLLARHFNSVELGSFPFVPSRFITLD